MRSIRITEFKNYLIKNGLYTESDDITLIILDNSFTEYQKAVSSVKSKGQTIQVNVYQREGSNLTKTILNPSFDIMLSLQIQLFKILESFSKRTKAVDKDENPFEKMLNTIRN